MEQRISLVTLGVADLQRAVAFYENALGWKAEASPPGVVFFDLNGFVFALWPHTDMAHDLGVAAETLPAYRGSALAYNARSEAEVDAVFDRLKAHGANILKPPHKTFWGGYSGYFCDPDSHVWEIAHNPFWTVRADGRISMKQE
jgi:catechol 2,3-dioxygenase-like lactoylglutathione lyase family enzyme